MEVLAAGRESGLVFTLMPLRAKDLQQQWPVRRGDSRSATGPARWSVLLDLAVVKLIH
jgi:hypothetical protein